MVVWRLAKECGRQSRTIYHWLEACKTLGASGFVRKRSDAGVPHIYSESEFEIVIAASVRLRRHPHIKIRHEWKALNLPGSYETFRFWVRRLQFFGYLEAAPTAVKERVGA